MILCMLVFNWFSAVAAITDNSNLMYLQEYFYKCTDAPEVDCQKFVKGGLCTNKIIVRHRCCKSCLLTAESPNEFNSDQHATNNECGLVDTSLTIVNGGEDISPSKHPWNAAIYRIQRNGTMLLICGGTLISSYCVLSAAHCTEARDEPNIEYKIVLGKQYREYSHKRDLQKGQYIDVRRIHRHELYQGEALNYILDNAIFELKEPAKINSYIRPACIDLEKKHRLTSDMTGKVVGWGLDYKDGESIPTLQLAEVPYVSYVDCINLLPIKKNIPKDKFCTAIKDGDKRAIQHGESGAGLTIEFDGKTYVYGIVSAAITDSITTFTDIRKETHLDFILKILKQTQDRID